MGEWWVAGRAQHGLGRLLPPERKRRHPSLATRRAVHVAEDAVSSPVSDLRRRFRSGYAAHRVSEGRGQSAVDARTLPYVTEGPLVRQWSVRARSFEAFQRRVLRPAQRRADVRAAGPLRLLDLGAGNGWLAHRAAVAGAEALALDLRDDGVDGLGAAPVGTPMERVAASFEALPLRDASFDVVVFNASLHYAGDLARALGEARRVARAGGRVVVVDSPFYLNASHGEEMLRAKRDDAERRFGARSEARMALAFVEYLTRERLADASRGLALGPWRRHRVRYPLWYELRAIRARLRRERPPSRFDLWEAVAS